MRVVRLGCYAGSSLESRTRLYAAPVTQAHCPVLAAPRYRVFLKPPTVFIQPKTSSTFFLAR